MTISRAIKATIVVLATLSTLLIAPLRADAAPVQQVTVTKTVTSSVQFFRCTIVFLCWR